MFAEPPKIQFVSKRRDLVNHCEVERNGARQRQPNTMAAKDAPDGAPPEFLDRTSDTPKSLAIGFAKFEIIPEAIGYNVEIFDEIRRVSDHGWDHRVVEQPD